MKDETAYEHIRCSQNINVIECTREMKIDVIHIYIERWTNQQVTGGWEIVFVEL